MQGTKVREGRLAPKLIYSTPSKLPGYEFPATKADAVATHPANQRRYQKLCPEAAVDNNVLVPNYPDRLLGSAHEKRGGLAANRRRRRRTDRLLYTGYYGHSRS